MARPDCRQGPPAPVPLAPARDDSNEDEAVDDIADLFPEEEEGPTVQPDVPALAVQHAVQPAGAHGPAVRPPCDEDLAVAFYKQVLCFNNDAAHSLAFDQQLVRPSDFLELEEDNIDDICQAIRKPGGISVGSQVAVISVT